MYYLRHERFFVLLVTHGHHPFYDEEAASIRDVRRVPIGFAGYSMTVKNSGYSTFHHSTLSRLGSGARDLSF